MTKLLTMFLLVLGGLNAADTPYAGVWEAKFKGEVFLVLKVQPGEKIEGTMQAGTIRFDEDGELTEARLDKKESPLQKGTVDAGKLSFVVDDDGDPVTFEMKITAPGEADLQLLGAPVPVKAFHLRRR